jgi:hypothetical protein
MGRFLWIYMERKPRKQKKGIEDAICDQGRMIYGSVCGKSG